MNLLLRETLHGDWLFFGQHSQSYAHLSHIRLFLFLSKAYAGSGVVSLEVYYVLLGIGGSSAIGLLGAVLILFIRRTDNFEARAIEDLQLGGYIPP